MPREDRRIIFDLEELLKAIYLLNGMKSLPPPPSGVIGDVAGSLENPTEVNIVFKGHANSPEEPIRYKKDFVIAALMTFCHDIGIPLPKGANKTLEMESEQIVLRVQRLR